jgi:16S rRNA (uracil1498-N3)-methyltransferase
MHRFYIPQKISSNQIDIMDAEQLHHLKDVLRLKAGDEACVFDEAGYEYLVTISDISQRNAVLAVKNQLPAKIKKHKIAIACAIPKKSGMDDIVDKLTQLDVDVIVPLVTERVIVKLENEEDPRFERWKKIALNAAEQSHRNTLPTISPAMKFTEMLAASKEYEVKLIPTLGSGRKPINHILNNFHPKSVLVAIGPEGDFTPLEVDQAVNAGFLPVSLGNTVLRVETAAIAIVSYINLSLL